MAELQPFARSLGVAASGPKADLTERVAAQLSGRPIPKPTHRTKGRQLSGDPELTTVIPDGQRSNTALRAFFVAHVGNGFRFDGHMRSFLLEPKGATLGDAVAHWHATRNHELPAQSKSLEFNAFTKEWHRHYPDRSSAESRAAWDRFRSLPIDERPPVAEA